MTFTTYGRRYDVLSMWGDIDPQWRLLKNQLDTKGPGWYPPWEREQRLITNRSNRPGDDMKDALRTDGDPMAWQIWSSARDQLLQLRQPGQPLKFPGEEGIFLDLYAQLREEEQIILPPFTCAQPDAPLRKRKKRKHVEDGALTG